MLVGHGYEYHMVIKKSLKMLGPLSDFLLHKGDAVGTDSDEMALIEVAYSLFEDLFRYAELLGDVFGGAFVA